MSTAKSDASDTSEREMVISRVVGSVEQANGMTHDVSGAFPRQRCS